MAYPLFLTVRKAPSPEDIPTLRDVRVDIALPDARQPARVYLAPGGEEIPFTVEEGKLSFTLHKLWCHAPVVLEF